MNDIVAYYEKEKAEKQKWLDENKELEGTTVYQGVLLGVAIYDFCISMAKAFAEAVAWANNVSTFFKKEMEMTWVTVYELEGNPDGTSKKMSDGREKCLRVWRRQLFAGVGDGFISREGEVLVAEGAEAQRLYDEELREYKMSA
jgi:hypothetical protein